MALRAAKGVQARFTRYIESLVSVIGHADRAGPLRDYCTGLIVSEARKSVEPMAAITAPDRTAGTGHRVDYPRHGPSQKGAALGWGSAPILRTTWQAGELPSRRIVVD